MVKNRPVRLLIGSFAFLFIQFGFAQAQGWKSPRTWDCSGGAAAIHFEKLSLKHAYRIHIHNRSVETVLVNVTGSAPIRCKGCDQEGRIERGTFNFSVAPVARRSRLSYRPCCSWVN